MGRSRKDFLPRLSTLKIADVVCSEAHKHINQTTRFPMPEVFNRKLGHVPLRASCMSVRLSSRGICCASLAGSARAFLCDACTDAPTPVAESSSETEDTDQQYLPDFQSNHHAAPQGKLRHDCHREHPQLPATGPTALPIHTHTQQHVHSIATATFSPASGLRRHPKWFRLRSELDQPCVCLCCAVLCLFFPKLPILASVSMTTVATMVPVPNNMFPMITAFPY
jgi:hypothetical protein